MLLFAFIDSTLLIYAASFVAFSTGAWWVMDLLAAKKTRASERLNELKNPHKRSSVESGAKTSDTVTNVLKKTAPALAKPL